MKQTSRLILGPGLAMMLVVTSCQKKVDTAPVDSVAPMALTQSATAPVKQGDGRGVIKQINAAGKSITLDHNDIPGVMDAMAMPYKVDDAGIMSGLAVGDSVVFTLQDRGEGNYVVS